MKQTKKLQPEEETESNVFSPSSYKTCECCGKQFYRFDYTDYQYKLHFGDRDHFYCRYNCWRTAQKQLEEAREKLKNRSKN